MSAVEAELGLVALAAMLSPTTLTFSVLALVLGERPLRTGVWFYLGAFTATLAVGVLAAFVLGNAASSGSSTPKTWVAIVDVAAGVAIVALVARALRRPADPRRTAAMVERMSSLAASPAVAIVAAGATLANPGGFIPLALKEISQIDPSAARYCLDWLLFTLVALAPLGLALVAMALAPTWAARVLQGARGWLERHAMTLAAAIVALLAVALLRNGIAGL
ncbi:MAG TPA: GAP family protein, partial [Solirubrobacteraceae bacterium]|nr:GAP family protein [Solirubrobacteraceae bacterium]